MRRRSLLLAVLLWSGVGLTCVALARTDLRRVRTAETGDFVHFYAAADADRAGADPYAAHTRGYIYPPLLAWAAQPLGGLSIRRAAGVMLGVNVAVTVGTLGLLAGEFLRRFDAPRRDAAAVGAVVLIGLLLDADKVKGEWQMWQTDVWMLLAFTLGLRWVDRRPGWAGVALGVGANLKYLPLLLVPYLLARRRWGVAICTVVAAVGLAVLPAVQLGWDGLGRQWAAAAGGLTGMAGGDVAGERAEVHPVGDSLSCSVTSAIARGVGRPAVAFAVAGGIGVAMLAGVAVLYRRRGVRLTGQASAAVVGVEWPAAVAVLLAFSPQTNTRHLYDALLVTTAGATLAVAPPVGVRRWPIVVGLAVLAAGFTLPPGHRTVQGFWSPTVAWLRMGGPCICLLVAAGAVLWTGVRSGAAADPGLRSTSDPAW